MTKSSPALAQSVESAPGYFGWRVLVGAVVGLALSPGPVALLLIGALAPGLAAAHGWSFGAIMFSITIFNLASIVAAPVAGYLIDRFGVRRVMLPSIVVMAICLPLWGYAADTLTRFFAISALYGFATIGAQSLTYTKLLTSWFDDKRGLVLGIASAGLGLGYFLLPWIIAFGFAHFGPAGATVLLAGMLIAFPLLLNVLFAHPREETAAPVRSAAAAQAGMSLSGAAATAPFWIMAAAIFLISVIATGIVPNFASIAHGAGFDRNETATIASLFGLATLGGRLLVGWLFDRYFAPRVACVIFLVAAVGYGLAAGALTLNLPMFVAAVMLMGLGFGAESDLIGYLASRYFGYRHFGAIYGALLAIFVLGVAAGPLLYGMARDATGSYQAVLGASAVIATAAAALMLLLPRFPATAPAKVR
jgi:MFS family permease